jgi:hypothetical protein
MALAAAAAESEPLNLSGATRILMTGGAASFTAEAGDDKRRKRIFGNEINGGREPKIPFAFHPSEASKFPARVDAHNQTRFLAPNSRTPLIEFPLFLS